jgi:hypothetical protein
MDLDQATPSSNASASDEGESAASSTLFFEKDDTLLIVDDVSSLTWAHAWLTSLSGCLPELGYARIYAQDLCPLFDGV